MSRYNAVEVAEKLDRFLIRYSRISLSKMEEMTQDLGGFRVSKSYLSIIRNQKWDSEVSQEMLASIIRTINQHETVIEQPVQTKNLSTVMAICEESIGRRSMHVIIAESGYGKSTAFETYLKSHPDAIGITADPTMRTKSLLEVVCRALDITFVLRHSPHRMVLSIIEENPKQIIIDDAHRLNPMTFEVLRRIHDGTDTSIIIMGQQCLTRKLTVAGDRAENLTQLISRIGFYSTLQEPSDKEIAAIIRRMGIEKEDVIKAIVRNSRVLGYKNLHRVRNLVEAVKTMAVENKRSLNDFPAEWVESATEGML